MSSTKVLVVDDSAFMRKVIKHLLELDQNIIVLDTARNGQEALRKLTKQKPDVITLDIEMPVMNGLETLKEINAQFHVPVVMLSSTTQAGAEHTLIALENGAFDFIAKPSGSISLDLHDIQNELITKVKLAHQYSQVPSKAAKVMLPLPEKHIGAPSSLSPQRAHVTSLIFIGTSTGGPRALQQLLSSLPKMDQTAILVVQHMPASFTHSLAKRLDELTPHNVVEAQQGELIRGGHVYIAPGGLHMEVRELQHKMAIQLHDLPPVGGHRPSVNVLLESAVNLTNYELITIIMTGMGKDGTEGLKKLSQANKVHTIAQDESTSVVYGMPKSVIEANLIHEIVPLGDIPTVIQRLLKG